MTPRPNRIEIIERLRRLATAAGNDVDFQDRRGHPTRAKQIREQKRVLTEAADLLEGPGGRVLYRVAVDSGTGSDRTITSVTGDPKKAVMKANRLTASGSYRNVRIQKNEFTFTETGWVDVKAGEGDQ